MTRATGVHQGSVNPLFTTSAEPRRQGMSGATPRDTMGQTLMASFVQLYLQYRRVGLGRMAALHYAWVVVTTRRRPMSIR
jgi:hypothetical protein